MLVNIIGSFTFEQRGDALFVGTEESAALVADGQARLAPPEPTFLAFKGPGVTAHVPYGDGPTVIHHASRPWSSDDCLLGGTDLYGVWLADDADGKSVSIVRDWSNNVLATLPYLVGPRHFASQAMVQADDNTALVHSPKGELIADFSLQAQGAGIQSPAHFAGSWAFLRTHGEASACQVFDLHRLAVIATLRVAVAIFGICALPDGRILLADADGLHRWDAASPDTLHTLHDFDSALDAGEVQMLLWHDPHHAYVSIDHDHARDRHSLLAVPLAASPGDPVQSLHWSSAWATTIHGGFLAGQNFLSLKRKTLLADNAVLVWTPGQPLSADLFQPADHATVEVESIRSTAKGKHGYRVRVEDDDANRAVRLAALELGRLLGETCKGPYVQVDEVADRQFDGAFQVDIVGAGVPSDFERGFLPAYLDYFRDEGSLQPAGSKARLSVAVTWAGDGST